jgi:hypothetical protein
MDCDEGVAEFMNEHGHKPKQNDGRHLRRLGVNLYPARRDRSGNRHCTHNGNDDLANNPARTKEPFGTAIVKPLHKPVSSSPNEACANSSGPWGHVA